MSSIGNFPEGLSQAILVGRFLVGRLAEDGRGWVAEAPLSNINHMFMFNDDNIIYFTHTTMS